MRILALSALALLAACQAEPAKDAAEGAKAAPAGLAQAGVWIFENDPAQTQVCIMSLDDDSKEANFQGLHDVWFAGGCEGAFSILGAVSGWESMEGGGVKIIGAEGSTFGEFQPGADGILRAVVENDGEKYLMRRPLN
jgi:hypothetical protein